MEETLFTKWFGKLLDALRIGNVSETTTKVDHVADRLSQDFQVVSEGIIIKGRLFFPVAKPSKQYPVLIICHGIPASSLSTSPTDPGYEGLALDFTSIGIACVIFNFRGCGDSGGDFNIMGWTRDLEAVHLKVVDTPYIDPTRIIILGFSGGGAAAIRVTADTERVYGLALGAAPAHFKMFVRDPADIIKDFKARGIIRDSDYPTDVHRWLKAFDDIEPRHWINHFKGKHILIVHGDSDELIPIEHAHELHGNAPAGISELVIIPGGAHKLRHNEQSIQAIKNWILRILGWSRVES